MKTVRICMLYLALCGGAIASTNEAAAILPQQNFSITFEGSDWKPAHTAQSDDTFVIVWTRNETATNLTQRVTMNVSFADTNRFDAPYYANLYIQELAPGSRNFTVRNIVETPNNVVAVWSHGGGVKQPAQREVVHIRIGKDGIYRLSYTVLEQHLDAGKFSYWLKTIMNAKLVDAE